MQKLSYAVLDKLIEKHVTSAEIDILLYISRYQNNQGVAKGMYYKTICEDIGIAYQTFYDAKEGLIEKGIISVKKKHYLDCDITILDNDFTDPSVYKKGYINTNRELFVCSQFRMMKAKAKLLAMDIMKNNLTAKRSYHKETRDFIEDNKKLFQICERTLRQYIKELRLLFSIGVKDKKYWFTIRDFAKKKQKTSEAAKYRQNSIDVAIRRNRIQEEKVRKEDVRELHKLMEQYDKEISMKEKTDSSYKFSLSVLVEKSIKVINAGKAKKNWKRKLKPKLIHRILRKELGLEVRDLIYDMTTV